jgi:hypothetical protein
MSQLLYDLLNVHVYATDAEVIEKLKSRFKKGASPTSKLEQSVLAAHHAARELFEEFRF